MTREEYNYVRSYVDGLFKMIQKAKNSMRDMNFGKAVDTLSEPYDRLKIRVTDVQREKHG